MAAQIFAPQFLILRRVPDKKEITINANNIEGFEEDSPDTTKIWTKNGNYMSVTVYRKFGDFNNDVSAKNCK